MKQNGQIALIALGSNEKSIWGDSAETVQKGMQLVGALSSTPPVFSDLYATPAFPKGSGPAFVNAAIGISTALSAPELLDALHEIEAAANRKRERRWAPRTLDIDLIALGDVVLPDAQTQTYWRDLPLTEQQQVAPTTLILPHPRLQDRAFVLVPLLDVAPAWVHPLLELSISQMCASLPAALRAEVIRREGSQDP